MTETKKVVTPKKAKPVEKMDERSELLQNLEARIAEVNDYKGMIDIFIQTALTKDIDYGIIKIKRKDKKTGKYYEVESKSTLFKAGAEKFASLDKARAVWSRDDETWEMLGMTKGILCYTCHLKNAKGQTIGEGKGTAKAELEGSGADFNINKQVKIAKKRAFVDAVLTTYSLSERFVQDLEDMPKQNGTSKPQGNGANKVSKTETNALLVKIRPAINSLNMARTPEQLQKMLEGIVKDAKYQGKALY